MLDMPIVPGLPRGLARTSADRVVPGLTRQRVRSWAPAVPSASASDKPGALARRFGWTAHTDPDKIERDVTVHPYTVIRGDEGSVLKRILFVLDECRKVGKVLDVPPLILERLTENAASLLVVKATSTRQLVQEIRRDQATVFALA